MVLQANHVQGCYGNVERLHQTNREATWRRYPSNETHIKKRVIPNQQDLHVNPLKKIKL